MTGPDHYREAERLIVEAATFDVRDAPVTLAAAQVHATLALAAAAALPTTLKPSLMQPWAEATR